MVTTIETRAQASATNSHEQILSMLDDLPSEINGIIERRNRLMTEIEELVTAGITNATPYYKAGVYLTLVYPTDNSGFRKREYIGSNPEKISAALASIDRYAKWADLHREMDVLNHQLDQAKEHLRNVYYALHIHIPLRVQL